MGSFVSSYFLQYCVWGSWQCSCIAIVLFFFIAAQYSIVWLYHLILSGYLDCIQVRTMIIDAAVNFLAYVSHVTVHNYLQGSSSQTIWSQDTFTLLKKVLNAPESFCLCRLHLSIFALLEIKTENVKMYIYICINSFKITFKNYSLTQTYI